MTDRGGRRDEAGLRRRLAALLGDLGLEPPLTPERFCGRLADHRGRPIELVAWALPPEAVSGFLLVYEHKDVIVHQSRTSGLHQRHIVFHEVAHLVLDHAGCGRAPVPPGDGPPAAGPATLYDDIEEWEAETAATILSSWSDAAPGPPSRLGAALGMSVRWR